MNLLDRGKLFITEPELNRALASEMRFDPTATHTLAEQGRFAITQHLQDSGSP